MEEDCAQEMFDTIPRVFMLPRPLQLPPTRKSHSHPPDRPNIGHSRQKRRAVRCRRLKIYTVGARDRRDEMTRNITQTGGRYRYSSEPQDDFESLAYCRWNRKTLGPVV